MWTNQIKTSVLAIQRTQSGSTHRIEEIIWQSASSTVRVFIRQGDRYSVQDGAAHQQEEADQTWRSSFK